MANNQVSRPIRFGTGAAGTTDPAKLLRAARRAEDMGFSVFALPDHFMMPLAPLIALQAVADATTTLRIGQLVLANDFRHPAVLAKELATLDVLSAGRLEIGIGAGWMREEFEQAGLPFDRPSIRIERLEESITVMKGLFGADPVTFSGKHFNIAGLDGTPKPVQSPHPPVMIGGGGPKLLAVAARQADIIQLLPGPNTGTPSTDSTRLTGRAFLEKIDFIRGLAGERFDEIELGTLLMHVAVTDDVESAADDFLGRVAGPGGKLDPDGPSTEDLLASPVVAIGSLEQVCDKLLAVRETFGFSYFTGPINVRADSLAPLLERLAAI